MASLAISLLADPNAYAGTFVWQTTDSNGNVTAKSPVYSGGSVGGGPSGPNSSVSTGLFTSNGYYIGNAGYAGYSNGGCNADAKGNATSVSLTASGPLTAKFTWQPAYLGEPPPASVIIYQDCRAALTNNRGCNGNSSSSCTDGLGGSATLPFSGMQAATESNKYSVGTVGSDGTVSVSCSPSAVYSFNCSSGVGSYAAGAASISYTAAAYPVTVNLTGGIGLSTAKRLLIGQQLKATLNSGPLTPTSWNWGVSGGGPFNNFLASDSLGVYTALGPQTSSQLVCNFSQPSQTVSINCSAHLAVPAGASPVGGLNVSAVQPLLAVEKPSATLDVFIGTVTDLPTSVNPNYVALQQTYTYPPTGQARGITWIGKILTPAEYIASGSSGSWNWTQLITAQRQQKNNGTYWQFAVNTTNPATVINGVSVLDGTYPYGYFWYPANGVADGNADSPGQPLDQSTTIREYDVSDSFDDYLMYLPPGSGSWPVPLKRSGWYWNFQALKDPSSIWSTSGKNAQWGFVGDFPAFPTWTFNAAIGHLVYVAP